MNLCFLRIQKTEAKDLFNPAWVYAEAEKVDRLFKKRHLLQRSQEDQKSSVNLQTSTTSALSTITNQALKSFSLEQKSVK